MPIRLNRFIAEQGICSRRKADDLIARGKVQVNGRVAELGARVEPSDHIVIEGRTLQVRQIKKRYQAFYKPVGIMTSVDPTARDTIRSYLNLDEHMFPVGRLDVASSGLLLITNDGDLSERITHPKYHHEKEYVVSVNRPIVMADLRQMANGMVILGSKTKRAKTKKIGESRFTITLTEGRNRQIRRMCQKLGYEVVSLKRVRVMNILLGNMQPGEIRDLTAGEIRELKSSVGLS